ncbi:MAG: MBOAT family O-acyltransferase [Candidatus Aenigmarchaeota archaeon]|nr:MBOAT family O-acyltransferase [Candidatus Aenigmarchaeota archaeon]MDI6722528.1 MBOAT family O-acyltransferase [Candidatus Aenigmarchaeota archaeon]
MRHYVIIISGFIFYEHFAGDFVYILAAEILAVYILAKKISKTACYAMALVLPVAVLAFYKYRFLHEPSNYLSWFNYITNSLIIPLGLSFLTFEIIHYVVDLRNRKIKSHNLADFMAFIMFFPSFSAGPIKRFQKFFRQPKESRFRANNIFLGLLRIITGLFKKIVIADSISFLRYPLSDPSLFLGEGSFSALWVSVFAFSLEIYFDFSAYSDIAIGSAKMFGIALPENFNNPYLKTSISSFWRNWHISLYKWVADYIYLPLGGSRVSKINLIRNVFIIFFIIGMWHGGSVNFILWGLYHGFIISLHRLYGFYLRPRIESRKFYNSNYMKLASIALTFTLISVGWVFFVISDLKSITFILKNMFLIG